VKFSENSTVLKAEKSYRSPFSRWNESSWIRSKPFREDGISGLPFSPDLVPLVAHAAIAQNPQYWLTVLAYRLLAHLQFTTRLELSHVNPVCSALAQGQAPISLTAEQQNDALKIYCDEGGHALFVEHLSRQIKEEFEIDSSVLGRPQFDRVLEEVIGEYQGQLSPDLIRLFFVTVSETLVTKILQGIPHEPRVASVVRTVIGDHAADEALHSIYFRNLFPLLWHSLSMNQQEKMGQLLPKLVWAFLGPDYEVESNIVQQLGFSKSETETILQEVYQPEQVAQDVRLAVSPTLKMFETAGIFANPAIQQAFADSQLL
jgi:hypothetical protein